MSIAAEPPRKSARPSGVRRRASAMAFAAAFLFVLAARLTAQTPQAGPVPAWQTAAGGHLEFDVASVKQNKSGFPWAGGDPSFSNIPSYGPDDTYQNTGGAFSVKNYPLLNIIAFAYKSSSAQGDALIASLPAWVLNESFNIEARSDHRDASKDQMRLMMQSLLEERFHIAVRIETRQVAEYAAVLIKPGKLGPGLRPHPEDQPCSAVIPPPGQPAASPGPRREETVAGGFPALCGGFVRMQPTAPYRRREGSRNISMAMIVSTFTSLGNLGRPVIDQTGLTGSFDWVMEFLPQFPPGVELPPEASGPTFLESLKDQVGIKLVPQKGPFDYILVDHIEHPSEN